MSKSDRLVIGLQLFDQCFDVSILHVITVNQVRNREASLIWALTSSFSSSSACYSYIKIKQSNKKNDTKLFEIRKPCDRSKIPLTMCANFEGKSAFRFPSRKGILLCYDELGHLS